MKKKLVVVLTIFMVLFCVLSINNYVFAAGSVNGWINKFNGTVNDVNSEVAINNILGKILGIVQIIAMGSAIIMLTYLGIKYMSAAPTERANIKTHMITFFIGCVLVFGAAKILELVTKISQNTIK